MEDCGRGLFKEFHNLLGGSEDKYHKAEDYRLSGRELKPGPPSCQSFALLGAVSVAIIIDVITLINGWLRRLYRIFCTNISLPWLEFGQHFI